MRSYIFPRKSFKSLRNSFPVFGDKGRKSNRSVDKIIQKTLLLAYIAMAGFFGLGKIEWNIPDSANIPVC